MMMKNALIAGATGLIGRELLKGLLSDNRYEKVVAVTRRPLPFTHGKLVNPVLDFSAISNLSVPFDIHDAFCALGTTIKTAGTREAFKRVDHDYVVDIGKWCQAKHVQQFLVVSSMGADPNSRIFYNRVKGEMEKSILGLGIPSVHILRPSLLMGKREESRPGEKVAQFFMKGMGFLFIGGLKKYKGIQGALVAEAMIKLASVDRSGNFILESDQITRILNK